MKVRIIGFLCSLTMGVYAQQPLASKAFQDLVEAVDVAYQDSIDWSQGMPPQRLDNWYQEADTFLLQTEANIISARKAAARKDWGLRLESSANYYFREVNDLENNNPLRSLFASGFSWELLKGGYWGQQQEVSRLENLHILQSLDKAQLDKKNTYEHRYNRIIYWHHLQKQQALANRMIFLDKHLKVLRVLHRQHEISWEELQRTEQAALKVQIDHHNSQQYVRAFQKVYANYYAEQDYQPLPLVDIEIDTALITDSLGMQRRIKLLQDNINTAYRQQYMPSLSLKGRMNYRSGTNSTEVFPSIALQLQVPFRFGKTHQQLPELEKQAIREEELMAEISRQKELMNNYYEFQFKRKHLLEYQSELQILQEELFKRHLLYQEHLSTDFFWTSIQLIHRKQQIEIASLDALKDMHLQLLNIYSKSNCHQPSDLIKLEEVENDFEVLIALDSCIVDSAQLAFYAQYLRVNQWKKVYLALEDPEQQNRWRSFFSPYQLELHFTLTETAEITQLDVSALASISELYQQIEYYQQQPTSILIIQNVQQLVALDQRSLSIISQDEEF